MSAQAGRSQEEGRKVSEARPEANYARNKMVIVINDECMRDMSPMPSQACRDCSRYRVLVPWEDTGGDFGHFVVLFEGQESGTYGMSLGGWSGFVS